MSQAYISKRNRIRPNGYKIKLYRYGEIYATITVEKGRVATLPTCAVAYSDDTFYGWSTGPQLAVNSYSANSGIKPGSDMNLYAVFSYNQNTAVEQTKSVTSTDKTIKVTDAVSGTSYAVLLYTKTTTTEKVGYEYPIYDVNGNYQGQGYGVKDVTHETVNTTKLYSGTASSSTISYTYSGTETLGEYHWIGLNYTARVTQTGTFHRVVSHDEDSIINIYRYGVLYKTFYVKEGLSIQIGTTPSTYSDDTFAGYSIDSTSTTRDYTDTSKIAPHGVLNLYTVFSYSVKEEETTITGRASGSSESLTIDDTYTASSSGTLTISQMCRVYLTGSGSSTKAQYEHYSKTAGLSVNSTAVYESIPYSRSVNKGDVVKITMSGYGVGLEYDGTLPHLIDVIKYRVVIH